ncbi:DUF748 domain-containing protein [Pseudomonas kuykendallii]|uniref:DUF748 domain-containing protein n=1 Tax=Pseudomonas kuykendallii TaxID=1007099 RepID=UPI0028D1AE12|nr:DUF748 domain-containing protein [Pseudomonas kuykendallii]
MKRRYSMPLWIALALVLLLLVAHLALPYVVRDYLNGKLADMGEYRGQIADVDLAWWRGAYRINGLVIEKASGDVPVPLLEAPLIDLSVSWHSLWYDHAVVAQVIFQSPKLNFVDSEDPKQDQTGEGVDWRDQLEQLLPITLNEVRVVEGRLAFRNFQSQPPVDVFASEVDASVYNLTNTASADGRRVATFKGHAALFGQAPLEASASFDPFTNFEDFQLRLRMTDLELKRLNDFSRAYGKFDFAAGTGDLVIEAEAQNAQLSGYIKPLLRDVDVFNWKQDVENREKGFFQGLWEAVVGGGQTVLKNQSKDQFATRIELSGSMKGDSHVNPFQAFVAILRNAFVQAFTPRFERALSDDRE